MIDLQTLISTYIEGRKADLAAGSNRRLEGKGNYTEAAPLFWLVQLSRSNRFFQTIAPIKNDQNIRETNL